MSRRLAAFVAYPAASVFVLLPVLLPRHVPAMDLPSHLYNTWLAFLVREGRAPGLELVPQWSNILFDWWLEGLWRLGGQAFAEKMAVSAAVLIFFWGAFSWVSAMTRHPAWLSAPLIAMLTYGWIYHQGFFNFYLSCGFGFWALSWLWNRPARVLPAAAALALAVLAHPLGAAAASGLAAFVALTRSLDLRRRALAAALCCAGLAAAGQVLYRALPAQWEQLQIFHVLFATQLRPFGENYTVFTIAVPSIWATFLLLRAMEDGRALLRDPAVFVVAILAVAIVAIPASVVLPGTARPLNFVDFRLAVFLSLVL